MVRGYKVFNYDWTCRPLGGFKQYTCPGKFEENISPIRCKQGMHFCKCVIDCFHYYDFNPKNRVAEVIAYGDIAEEGDKCCTNKLEIVREISWSELLEIVNVGKNNTGVQNVGYQNTGNRNIGDFNTGEANIGNRNTGFSNLGRHNSGYRNIGNNNSGDWNHGNRNSGNQNIGNHNSGDWNKCSFSNGCFNTVEPEIYLFNKPSKWTYRDWINSDAAHLLNQMPKDFIDFLLPKEMTDEEKEVYPEAETIGGYNKIIKTFDKDRQIWWNNLSTERKNIIKSIPNFDKNIFKEITGIDIDETS